MNLLTIFQVLVSILLIASILLQQRGTSVSSVFGGEGLYYFQRRGLEKFFFRSTIFLSAIFLLLAISSLLKA